MTMRETYPLLIFGLIILWLTGCSPSENQQSGNQNSVGAAQLNLAVNLPEPQVTASYLDTSKTYGLTLKVYESQWGSTWEAVTAWNNGENQAYEDCLTNNSYDYSSCNYRPGQLVKEITLSYDNPSTQIDLPTGQYLFQIEQLEDPNNPASVFARAASFATLESGNNDVVINLAYGSWQFTTPLELQLLDATFANQFPSSLVLDASGTDRLTSTDYTNLGNEDWSQDLFSPGSETVVEGLGLAPATASTQLKAIHLTGLEQLKGYGQQALNASTDLYYGNRSTSANFDQWGQVFIPYQGITLETNAGEFLGMGWKKSPSPVSGYQSGGVSYPATLAQQFTGNNFNRLDLGQIVSKPNYSGSMKDLNAGLFFLTANHSEAQAFNPAFTAGSSQQGSNYFTVQSHDGSGNVVLSAEMQNFWVDSGFPEGHFPLTRMTSADEIRGTLVEYVAYEQMYEVAFDPVLTSSLSDLPTLPSLELQASTYPDSHPQCEKYTFGSIEESIRCELRAADTNILTNQATSTGCFTFENRHEWVGANYDTTTLEPLGGFTKQSYWQTQLVRVCLHPFTMTAGPQSNPDQYQPRSEQLAALTLDKAGQLAFEALDINASPKLDKQELSLVFTETLNHYDAGITSEWCSSGSSSITYLVGGPTSTSNWVAEIDYDNCTPNSTLWDYYGVSCPDPDESPFCDSYTGKVRVSGDSVAPNALSGNTSSPVHIQTQDLKGTFPSQRSFSGIDFTGFHYQADYDFNMNASARYALDLAGNYFQFEMIPTDPSVDPLGVGYQHFNFNLDTGTGNPLLPEYYLSPHFIEGAAVRVSTDSILSYSGGSQVYGGTVKVEGVNGTWMTASANGDGTYNLTGEFDDKPGEQCTYNNVDWSLLNTEPNPITAADFTCTAL
ncbi:hypothetical protein [Marinospirillum perlucidum]|uniref:hypothetical protein n=1 Tax=Marinospirillum perlucidum TaxID=1982602 RepID=UPI0013906176|nr:hypothetical protein [Marinospirillum perlucidum]